MTAYELADLLFERSKFNGKEIPSNLDELCCAMLRQQAQEKAVLEGQESNYLEMIDDRDIQIAKLKDELDTINKAYMWMDETYKGKLVEIEKLKNELEDCICQGGHSEAYLKAKGKK